MNPDEIVKPGAPTPAWITPDGKFITTDPDEAKANNATHQVTASLATFKDGRKQWIVYTGADRSLAPGTYSPAGSQQGWDDDQRRIWQQGQTASERRVKRTYTGTDPNTGRQATVTEYEDGGVKYDEIKPTGSGTAEPPTTKDESGRRWVWKPNPGGPNAGGQWVDVGSAPLTPAERQAAEANQPTQTVATREVGGKVYTVITIVPKPGQPGTAGQVVLGPDGQQVAGGIPGEPPKRTPITRNGRTYIQVQGADGSIYFEDQSGARTTLPDEGNQPLPEGLPQFRPNFNDPDGAWGLITYTNQLRELMTKRKPDGTPYLTEKQFADLVSQAHTNTTASATKLDTIAAQQRQLQANEINQRNTDAQTSVSRLGQANSATQTALEQSQKMAGNMTPASYKAAGGPILQAIMALQAGTAAAYGGMNQPSRVGTEGYPVLQQMQGQTIPALTELTKPVPPNALGVGSVGVAPAPGGAPAAAAPGTTPIFRPAPPVAATPATAAAAPATVTTSPGAVTPKIRFRNGRTGEIREMTPMELDAMPDLADWYPVEAGGAAPIFTPTPSAPAAPSAPPMKPQQPSGVEPGLPPGAGIVPGAMPMQPAAGSPAGGNVQMAPPQMLPAFANVGHVGAVLSQQPGNPDWERAVRQAAQEMGIA